MWRAVGCPLLAREPRGLPRVVALGCLVPRVRGVVCFLFVGGADVAPEELVSALKPNLAQTLLVAESVSSGSAVLSLFLPWREFQAHGTLRGLAAL